MPAKCARSAGRSAPKNATSTSSWVRVTPVYASSAQPPAIHHGAVNPASSTATSLGVTTIRATIGVNM